MGGIGAPELIVVLAIILLLFGAPRLPALARSMGQAFKEFRKGTAEEHSDDDVGTDPEQAKKQGRSATSS